MAVFSLNGTWAEPYGEPPENESPPQEDDEPCEHTWRYCCTEMDGPQEILHEQCTKCWEERRVSP